MVPDGATSRGLGLPERLAYVSPLVWASYSSVIWSQRRSDHSGPFARDVFDWLLGSAKPAAPTVVDLDQWGALMRLLVYLAEVLSITSPSRLWDFERPHGLLPLPLPARPAILRNTRRAFCWWEGAPEADVDRYEGTGGPDDHLSPPPPPFPELSLAGRRPASGVRRGSGRRAAGGGGRRLFGQRGPGSRGQRNAGVPGERLAPLA